MTALSSSVEELSWAGLPSFHPVTVFSHRDTTEDCHTIDERHSLNGEHAAFVGTGWADLTCLCRVLAVHQACAPAQTSCSAYLLLAVLPPFKSVFSSHPIQYLIACRERSTHHVTAVAQSVPTASPAFRSATALQNNVLMARKGSASSEEHSAQEKQRTDVDCSCKTTVQPSRGVRSCDQLMEVNV